VPVLARAHDAAAARIRRGIPSPTGARSHPHDVRIVGGGRDDEGVVAVGDDDGIRVGRGPVTQATLDGADFADAVELIAREIQVHEDRRINVGGDGGHVHLVDLEGGSRRPPALHEGRNNARGHVVAVDVGGDGAGSFECRPHHAGRRRLTVRAGHDHGRVGGRQLSEELR